MSRTGVHGHSFKSALKETWIFEEPRHALIRKHFRGTHIPEHAHIKAYISENAQFRILAQEGTTTNFWTSNLKTTELIKTC